MRQGRPERVVARFADIGDHARQLGRVHIDAGEFLPRQVLRYRDRHEFTPATDLAQDFLLLEVVDGQEGRQRLQGALSRCARRFAAALGLLRHQQQPVVLDVACHRLAVTIDDQAALRGKQAHADAVVFRQHAVLFGADHLQVVEPCDQGGQQHALATDQDRRAPRERLVPSLLALLRSGFHSHRVRPPPAPATGATPGRAPRWQPDRVRSSERPARGNATARSAVCCRGT